MTIKKENENLRVTINRKTQEQLEYLRQHTGLTKTRLIQRLIDDAYTKVKASEK